MTLGKPTSRGLRSSTSTSELVGRHTFERFDLLVRQLDLERSDIVMQLLYMILVVSSGPGPD